MCAGYRNCATALAAYLTALHAKPVAEERIQVTASGMTAVSIALAATVRPGDRVVLHSPAWPNVGNAARLRGAQVDELPLTALPEGGFRLDFDRLDAMLRRRAGVHSEQSEQPHRLDRHARANWRRSWTSRAVAGSG